MSKTGKITQTQIPTKAVIRLNDTIALSHPDAEEENRYLEDVLAYLKEYFEEVSTRKKGIDEKLDYAIKHYNPDNPEQFVEFNLNLTTQEALLRAVNEMRYAMGKPYFARVDFIPDHEGSFGEGSHAYYIGKTTLLRGIELLIVDWRAPVSTLYYEGRLGRASYTSPDGEITGEITLKRQYTIDKGVISSITDIDITTNDAFLQAALGASKDRRLKDIVTTIQAEQNKVIRSPLFAPLIVQGVAGGGKTTIALHRIAWLLYNYEKNLLPKHVMIMAPNKFFLSYISDVLPDLGVERVTQTTFEDYAALCAGISTKQWKVNPAMQTLARVINTSYYDDPALTAARLKGDLRFMAAMRAYAKAIERRIPPREDFVLEGYELFAHEAIADLFLHEYDYLPVARRAAEIKKNLVNTLRREKPQIQESINADYDRKREELRREMPEDSLERRSLMVRLLDERDEKLKRIKYKSAHVITPFMQQFKMQTALTYYRALFEDTGMWMGIASEWFSREEADLLASHTLRTMAEQRLDSDDLPPILYLQMKLIGLEDSIDVKHIVIDEAQDFSLFQFAVLKALARTDSFSILGDLHQGIYAYKGVQDWESVISSIFPAATKKGNVTFLTLEQSYRTTVEIMEAANPVIAHLYENGVSNVPLAKPVIRHGEGVELFELDGLQEIAGYIEKKIATFEREGCQSIAVLAKTEGTCAALRKLMKRKLPLITGHEEQYNGGILMVPSYLTKGLEFDAVIIADASARMFNETEPLDIKLLYIAMTRALHRLAIYSDGAKTGLLSHINPAHTV